MVFQCATLIFRWLWNILLVEPTLELISPLANKLLNVMTAILTIVEYLNGAVYLYYQFVPRKYNTRGSTVEC